MAPVLRAVCPGCSKGLTAKPRVLGTGELDLRLKNPKLTWALFSALLLIETGFKSWPFFCQNIYNPLPFI